MRNKVNLHRFIACSTAGAFVAATSVPVSGSAAIAFPDVPKWSEEAVDYLIAKGAIEGYPDGTFGGEKAITRGEAAKVLATALNLKIDRNTKAKFADAKNHWASPYIAALQNQKRDIITGYEDGSFKPENKITRQEMAKMIVTAYELERNGEADVLFSDNNRWGAEFVTTLASLGVVNGMGDGKFAPEESVTRAQTAVFIHRTEVDSVRLEVASKPKDDWAVDSIDVINDTKFELTFANPIDEELAIEIEKSGKRFVVYHEGQFPNSEEAIQSQTISFNEDFTKAAVILESDDIRADVNYKIALIDSDTHHVASVIKTFGPVILKEGAAPPEITVSGEQDKLIIKFNDRMSDSALEVRHYQIYQSGIHIGNLADYVHTSDVDGDGLAEGDWVDGTERTAVEFVLNKHHESKKFHAGKNYKITVSEKVETMGGNHLSESERAIVLNVPSVSEAQPKASFARIVGNDMIVTFDKDLGMSRFNPLQVEIKKPSGHSVNVAEVESANGENQLGDKEIKLKMADGETLDPDLTYTIYLPAGGVSNAFFPNATNQEVNGLKVLAQEDVEVTTLSTKLVRQKNNKEKADLLLTFDQRVDVAALASVSGHQFLIKDIGTTYQLVDASSLELYHDDPTGRTVLIEDVETSFKLNGDLEGKGFKPESGKSYTVELKPNTVKTENSMKRNQATLTSKAAGISISAPEFDKIVLESAGKIIVHFAEEIDAKHLKASDIKVKGFERYSNGNFTETATKLSGDSQIKFTVSGKTLTITPANDKVKFVTGHSEDLVTIAADSMKGKASGVENIHLDSDSLQAENIIDYAAPMIIGAQKVNGNHIDFTYSEEVSFYNGGDSAMKASQFSVENATRDGYGTIADASGTTISITFSDPETFSSNLDLSKVKVIYTKNRNVYVHDHKANQQPNQTITGLKVMPE